MTSEMTFYNTSNTARRAIKSLRLISDKSNNRSSPCDSQIQEFISHPSSAHRTYICI